MAIGHLGAFGHELLARLFAHALADLPELAAGGTRQHLKRGRALQVVEIIESLGHAGARDQNAMACQEQDVAVAEQACCRLSQAARNAGSVSDMPRRSRSSFRMTSIGTSG